MKELSQEDARYKDLSNIEDDLGVLYEEYSDAVEDRLNALRNSTIIPFCLERGWVFYSAWGGWYLVPGEDDDSAWLAGATLDEIEDPEVHHILTLLSITLNDGTDNTIGDTMKEFPEGKTVADQFERLSTMIQERKSLDELDEFRDRDAELEERTREKKAREQEEVAKSNELWFNSDLR